MRRHCHRFHSDGICSGCGIHRNEFIEVVENEVRQMETALRNVLSLASRMKRRGIADADHMIRFCAEVGIVPRITRSKP